MSAETAQEKLDHLTDAMQWLEENLHHISMSRSVRGRNIRMWSSQYGGQAVAPTIFECVKKIRLCLD